MRRDSDRPLVLVIDDNPDTRSSASQLLAQTSYGVIEAQSAEAGLDLLRAVSRPVVVLFGNVMPGEGESGIGLLAAMLVDTTLAARHTYVLMTASPQRAEAELHEVLTRLGVLIIAKPFDADALLAVVAQAAQRLTAPVNPRRKTASAHSSSAADLYSHTYRKSRTTSSVRSPRQTR